MGICLIIKSGGGTDTSNATATADKILSGYTIYSNDNKITGSMPNIGTQTTSGLNAGGSTTIKAGWHDGNGAVTTNSLSSQTSADIPDASWCLSGYTYWKNGSKSTGTMTNRGTKTWSIGANGSQPIETGWHNGSGTVKQSINVDTGEWGPTPTTTNQQLCWSGWYYSKNRWCWGNSNLVAGNIKKGVSIFGVSGSYVEPRRYIIQNGVLCSGIQYRTLWYSSDSSDDGTDSWRHTSFSSTITASKLSSDNSYIMLTCQERGGANTTDNTYAIFRGVIGHLVSAPAWSSAGRVGGALCGDFFISWVSSGRYVNLYADIVSKPGTADMRNQRGEMLSQHLSPACGPAQSYITYRQTGVSYSYLSGERLIGNIAYDTVAQQGDLYIHASGYNHYLWCKNLWYDTSVSIS